MNNYQNERMKLWREVYVLMLSEHPRDARCQADMAVERFDEQFLEIDTAGESVTVIPEQAG